MTASLPGLMKAWVEAQINKGDAECDAFFVLGAGFAGLWSAVAAARRLDELGAAPGIMKPISMRRVSRSQMCSTRSKQSAAARLIGTVFPVGLREIAAVLMKMTEARSGTA
jgi:hypothetical protein